jgi:hypothetical protein
LNRDFPKLTSLSFSLRPSVLRHVMYTIVDRYDNERETWSKSTLNGEGDKNVCNNLHLSAGDLKPQVSQ